MGSTYERKHCEQSCDTASLIWSTRDGIYIIHVLCTLLDKQSQFPRCITWNVEENLILHEIFRVVSRFPRHIVCYIAESQLPLGQCTCNWKHCTIHKAFIHHSVTWFFFCCVQPDFVFLLFYGIFLRLILFWSIFKSFHHSVNRKIVDGK